MNVRNYILATAGHVDHGKSSLVKALTGIDPDRLPEEKARGITIDLGFAHLDLQSTKASEAITYHLGIVDVPGHEDFVKNMVAGVGSIDLALLIVAADDGWMPQTEEHLQILSYLGIKNGVVALTKSDLAQNEEHCIAEIREQLRGSSLEHAAIVPTSVQTGRGLSELKTALVEVLSKTPAPRNIGKPRLSVDRVFTLRGIGTVVTGTTTGGTFQRGEEVVVQPSGARGKIRSLQNHNREVEVSPPGTRTALNIPDVKGDPIQRGDVITRPVFGEAVKEIDARLEKSARLMNAKVPAARLLKNGTRVRIHLGSADVAAHVILNQSSLRAGEKTIARIQFEAPIYAFTGDRFIVRDWSEQATLAGGIVLDAEPAPENLKGALRVRFLEARAAAPEDLPILLLSGIGRFRALRENNALVKSRFSAAEITDTLTSLERAGKILRARGWAIDHAYWDLLLKSAAERVDAEHRTHPNRPGLSSVDFRASMMQELPWDELFPVFLERFSLTGFTISSNLVRRSNHLPSLPPKLQSAGKIVRTALSAKPFDPPSRKEVAPNASTQEALRFLLETGEAILLSEEVVMLADSTHQAAEIVRTFLRKQVTATASELRQALGTSRRVIIPLLEHFDRQGITRRDGDKRVLA